jgi:2-haloacid dehalogenase
VDVRPRWATFDCYGTLIDWDGGLSRELARLFPGSETPRLLELYHELEPEAERHGYRSYRDVLRLVLRRIAERESLRLPPEDEAALAESLPGWQPFPEVSDALEQLKRRGWRLAILSNVDRDLLEGTLGRLGVEFDATVTAEDVRSYKPAHEHWLRFFSDTGADRVRHVHVAASLFHDIAPASELGLRSVWVNRLDERPGPTPTREIHDLRPLPGVLDDLVAA